MPERIQLSRKRGWRMPPNTLSVARPGPFGNPFTPKGCREAGYEGTEDEIRDQCVEAFRVFLSPSWPENCNGEGMEKRRAVILKRLPELRGKNLACWCKVGKKCHADILLEKANESA